ncbi:MAG: hypothetical protein K5634_00545 [Sphaerochaetaceae bacterium]|nr:hypothetical protein [Sphaerochaetaceae bacterium]
MSKNISKNTIRKIILIMAILLISMAVYANNSITLGAPSTTSSDMSNGTTFTFPSAEIVIESGSNITRFYSLTVTVYEGHIHNDSITNLASGISVIADNLSPHKSATWLFQTEATGATDAVLSFLRGIKFVFKHNMKIDVSVSANETSTLPTGLTITSEIIDGKMHYYGFVPEVNKHWTDAYAAAKSLSFEGLKGYLATIKSSEEDAILDRITDKPGWAGAARVKDSDGPTLDQATATSYNPASVQIGQTKWKWVCGPEAGESIKIDGSLTLNYHQVLNGTGYSNWNVGSVNEPNSSGVYPRNSTGTGGEWVLQLHFENGKWNDLANDGEIDGYFVEFSDYTGGRVAGYVENGTISGTTELDPHVWSITADDTNNKFTATCSDPECEYHTNPLTLTVGIEYR